MSEDAPQGWFAGTTLDPRRADAIRREAVRASARTPWVAPEAALAAVFSVLLLAWAAAAVG